MRPKPIASSKGGLVPWPPLLGLVLALALAGPLTACNCFGAEQEDGAAALVALRRKEFELASASESYMRLGESPGLRPVGGVPGEYEGRPGVWLFGDDSGRMRFLSLEAPFEVRSELWVGLPIAGCAAVDGGLACTSPVAPGMWLSRIQQVPPILPRGGYADPTCVDDHLYALDTVASAWVRMPASREVAVSGSKAAVQGPSPLVEHRLKAGAYHALPIGRGQLAVLSAVAPRIALYAHGGKSPRVLSMDAPARAMAWDAPRETLWTVGPAPEAPTRSRGPLQGLYSVLLGFALNSGADEPLRIDLSEHGIIDATAVTVWRGSLVVVGTGSRNALIIDPSTGQKEVVPTGLGPAKPIVTEAGVVIPNKLEESVTLVAGSPQSPQPLRLPVGAPPSVRLQEALLGELLFYEKTLWSNRPDNQFTCNSCHWDLSTDHRLQPGIEEARWEMTRPLRGIAMVAPIFTPMQSPTLADAVRGLFTALDERYWTGEHPPIEPITVELDDGPFRVSASQAQSALLTFLMKARPRVGPLRHADLGFSELATDGARLFVRDCARCHEPTKNQRLRSAVAEQDLLAWLRRGPLSFGAPLYARSGVEPYYTAAGNRISPLLNLARGGPYFSNGSAATLEEVITRSQPGNAEVHPQFTGDGPAHYQPQEVAALRAFLLSI